MKNDYWKNYFELVSPTYMENWYGDLQHLTIESFNHQLNHAETKGLINFVMSEGDTDIDILPTSLRENVENCINLVKTEKVFVRLGSRSPKDNRINPITNYDEMLGQLLQSERIWEDLQLALNCDYLPHLFFREWIDMEKENEYRCFVKEGNLVGISQYYYLEVFDSLKDEQIRDRIIKDITSLHQEIKNGMNFNNYIFDVYIREGDKPILIEINPYSSWTDPCLFDWAIDKFEDLDFRYVKELPKRKRFEDLF